MIPIRQTLERQRTPWINRTLLVLNIGVFLLQLATVERAERIIHTWGMIPARLFSGAFGEAGTLPLITLVTSLFLHGGVVHLVGNLIYLGVFGSAVEDALGHARYAALFVLSGIVGSLAHAWVFPASPVPSIGASGAIAGVLGAFFVMHPQARVVTLVPFIVSWTLLEIRAIVFLPFWFLLQFFNGWLAIGSGGSVQEPAGIAWWAHVGGFVFGSLAGWMVRVRQRAREPRT